MSRTRTTLGLGALILALALAACRGPAALDLGPAQEAKVALLAAGITQSNFATRLALFANERNAYSSPAEVAAVEAAIYSALDGWGYDMTTQSVTVGWMWVPGGGSGPGSWVEGPFTMQTIIAEKAGTNPDLKPVLIAAHHDTVVGAPGADDNGTGCAALLEIADALQAESFERTIRFAFFAFEEDGLIGSRAYAASLGDAELPDSVIVLEMIGFTSPTQSTIPVADSLLSMPTQGDFIGVFGSRPSRQLVLDFLAAIERDGAGLPAYALSMDGGLGSNPLLQDLMRSDHAPFWARGVPALMVSDTANLRDGNHYHQASDTVTNVDSLFASRVTRAALSCLAVRAGIH